FEWLEDGALARSEAVLTICPELADYALSRAPIEGRHILIENSIFEPIRLRESTSQGVPSDEPQPLPVDQPLVYYAGTFETYQGINIVIDAFARLREKRPDVYLLMAGGNPDQVGQYRAMASELGLDGHCLFTGTISKALAQHYQGLASVLLSPRTAGMNTPLKVYELLASGTPLVATRIPSHTQVLNDEVCILTEPEAGAMAEGILAALDDDSRRSAIVRAAQELYRREYSRPVYVKKMRKVLELLR
ncbi:MAG: glycosyltransferase family 4 protein, partial [Gammaproteobacteria bacterium]